MTTPAPIRIAMWSGPRNISTAMMRAFGNRPDCAVVDEPFYAAYLHRTGADHPLRAAVLASQPTDPSAVIDQLLGPVPDGRAVFYQKQMTHHLDAEASRAWTDRCRNAFLIRAPDQVLRSYRARRACETIEELGMPQQRDLFDRACQRLGNPPPVIDAADVLQDPPAMLAALCTALGIPFQQEMLAWPAGRRETDGAWAPAWYAAVERSTGFAASAEPAPTLPLSAVHRQILDQAKPIYDRLYQARIRPG